MDAHSDEGLRARAARRIAQANAMDPYYVLAGRDPWRAPSRRASAVMVALTLLLFALFLLLRPDALAAIAGLLVALAAYYAVGALLVRRAAGPARGGRP